MRNVDLTGLTEKRNHMGTLYYEDIGVNIVAKQCRKCDEVKALDGFTKHKKKLGGKESECRECGAERKRKHREDNPEYHKEYNRKYREANPEYNKERHRKYYEAYRNCEDYKRRRAERNRKWAQANPDKVVLYKHNRRARKRSLPDTLTDSQQSDMLGVYDNTCFITECESYHLDHFIPLATGHGGTTYENMYPLDGTLNRSKGDDNPFEWFPQVKERYGLSQRKFDELVTYLAKLNGLSPKEYEDFVYWCHDNPRTVEETEADNERYGYKKPSIEIWREFTQDKAIS